MDSFIDLTLQIVKNDYFQLILTFLFGTFISVKLIPVIIEYSKKLNLVDKPNERKVHVNPIPNLGGIAIFLGFLLSTLGWMMAYAGAGGVNFEIILIIYGLIVLFVMGMVDDQIDMKASHKFLIQIAVAVVIAAAGLRIESFNGIFFIWELNIVVQYLFTILLVVGLTNAFNLIDGIDGLAGGLALINATVIGLALYNPNELLTSLIAFGLAGSLYGFLIYNFNPAKIFMGDTGSLVIGYMMAVLGIFLLNRGKVDATISVDTAADTTILVVGILVLPVYDTIRVFSRRILSGNSPFKPDKTHAHHLLIQSGFNHKKSALLLYVANIMIIGVAYFYYKLFDESFELLSPLRDIMGIGGLVSEGNRINYSLWTSFAIINLFFIAALFYDFRRIYVLMRLLFMRKKEKQILHDNVLLDDD